MPPGTPMPSGLTAEERRAFDEDGFFKLEGAIPRADAARMEDEWWAELADTLGVDRHDRTTWRSPRGDPKRPKTSPSERLYETAEVKRAVDGVLGEGGWDWPRDWGRACLTMPSGQPLEAWDVPTRIWHWDGVREMETGAPMNVFLFSFVAEARPGGGGTLVLGGSPSLVRRQYAGLTREQRTYGGTWQRDAFNRLGPWMTALTGGGLSPPQRVAAFMERGGEADGAPLRVVELTGEPGDMYVADPLLVHCVAPNCRDTPRMMRIGTIRSHAARAMIKRWNEHARQREAERRP